MEHLLGGFLVLLCLLIAEPAKYVNEDATGEKIPSKFCNVYKHVASLAEMGGSKNMSFWHLNCPFEGHYSLGDVVKRGSGQPMTWALMVKEESNGLLKHPRGFRELWKKRNHGTKNEVKILEMVCSNGYKALGNVVVMGYNQHPDRYRYRCVNKSLLVQGKSELISSLTDELGAWEIEADHAVTPDGLSAGTFIVMTNHNQHMESVYVLNEYKVTLKQHAYLQPNNSEDGSPCKIVCYVTKWAQYRPNPAKFFPQDINPDLCTHISFAFAIIRKNHLFCNGWNEESVLFSQIQALKKRNPALLTLLAVGGHRFGTAFSPMLSTAATRKTFINSAIPILRSYGFDGIELHFEHPGCRGSPPKDKHRFTLLIEEMTAAFEKEARATGNKKLLLTAAVAAWKETIDAAYEVDRLSKHLDYISVMAYNFHGGFSDRVTGHNSPLYAGNRSAESLYSSCKFAMLYWIQKGAPAYKLLMGFASYGRAFKLSTRDTSVGAPAFGPAHPGHYTHEAGFLSYYEICSFIKDGATVQWLDDQKVPYAYKGFTWVGYDNKKSFGYKARFVKKHKLGGGSVWAMDLDDFSGTFCNEGPYPLTRELKRLLEGNECSDAGRITVQAKTLQPPTILQTSTTLRPSTTFQTSTTLRPSTTLQTSTSLRLSTTLQTSTSLQPSSTLQASTTLRPSSTFQTSTTLRPSTILQTSTSLRPSSTLQASTTLRPPTIFQTSTTLRPSTTLRTSTSLRPSTTLQTSTTFRPTTIFQTHTTLRPSNTLQTSTTLRPTTTLKTSTSLRPSTTLQTATLRPPTKAQTSNSLQSFTALQNSTILQPFTIFRPSTTLQTSTTLRPPTKVQTSSSLQSFTALQNSTILQPFTIFRPSTTLQTFTTFRPSTTFGGGFCAKKPDGNYSYPSDLCKYFLCENKTTLIKHCPQNTVYDVYKKECVWSVLPPGNFCTLKSDGNYPYPGGQQKYFVCAGGQTWVLYCPKGEVFSEITRWCTVPTDIFTGTVD